MSTTTKSRTAPATTGTSFGELVRAYRKARGVGLVDLANRVGIDPALLSRVETGKRLPPDDMTLLRKIANGVGIREGADEYRDLLTRSVRDRVRATSEDEFKAILFALDRPIPAGEAAPTVTPSAPPTFCHTLAELISQSTEYAITSGATAITVRGKDGAARKFQLFDTSSDDMVQRGARRLKAAARRMLR